MSQPKHAHGKHMDSPVFPPVKSPFDDLVSPDMLAVERLGLRECFQPACLHQFSAEFQTNHLG